MSNYRESFKEVEREASWSLPRVMLWLVLLIFIFYVLGFAMTGGDLFIYKFWAPKRANAERVVFENTQSYVQGKTDYLSRLRFQYQSADGAQKTALRELILSESSTVDNSKLPTDLQVFIANLKGQF